MQRRFFPLAFLLGLAMAVGALGCAAFIDFSDPVAAVAFIPYKADSDIKFPHDVHSQDCESCHPGIDPELVMVEEVKDTSKLMRPVKTSCFECHERGQDCATCHEQMRPDRRPTSHSMNFRRFHGKPATEATARCDWCHGMPGTDNGCQRCHNMIKPDDHDLRWKNSGHGRAAVHNRGRCFVCHRSDQCARCHSQPPETHSAAFMEGWHGTLARRKGRSCFACHTYEQTCFRCHPVLPPFK